jgi:hypothetical protein
MAPGKKPETEHGMRTMSGLPLATSYGPKDLEARGGTYEDRLGEAGQSPYTRGPHATM